MTMIHPLFCSLLVVCLFVSVIGRRQSPRAYHKAGKETRGGDDDDGEKKDEKKWPTLSKQRRREVEGGG